MRHDVIVLGAGMVGISAALHVQQRGRTVVLVDRRGPAEETSYGNAGLIQSEGVEPYPFPRDIGRILASAFNLRSDAHTHWSALPSIAPALFAYWRNAAPDRLAASAEAFKPLAARCIIEHEALMQAAGPASSALLRRTGYVKVFRDEQKLAAEVAQHEVQRQKFAIRFEVLDRAGLARLEPSLLTDRLQGAVLLPDPVSVSDPGRLGQFYAELFVQRGGVIAKGDAGSFAVESDGYSVETTMGRFGAREAVVALGPWSGDFVRRLGYRVPMFVKRGYHMHYRPAGNASLARPVYDSDGGYIITPMTKGIRLTTGAEFALRESEPTPVQLAKVEPMARGLLPLADRVEAAPWMGRRPCLPDMLPVIGPAPRHKGLWFDFAHQHWGFTLGPVSGRLLAELMTNETPFTNPHPYRLDRF